VVKFEDLKLAG